MSFGIQLVQLLAMLIIHHFVVVLKQAKNNNDNTYSPEIELKP